jgi:hypothetical protein
VSCLQELCLSLLALLVLQQPQHTDTVTAAATHAMWMLQCAVEGQLPEELLVSGSMQALAAALSACTAALHELGILGLSCDRSVSGMCMCVVAAPLAREHSMAGLC